MLPHAVHTTMAGMRLTQPSSNCDHRWLFGDEVMISHAMASDTKVERWPQKTMRYSAVFLAIKMAEVRVCKVLVTGLLPSDYHVVMADLRIYDTGRGRSRPTYIPSRQ